VLLTNNVYIGCSGWSYQEWKGKFYPLNLSSNHYFDFYTSQFNTIEVNSTFYHYPSLKTVKNWYQKAPSNLKFTFKANQMITHTLKFYEAQEWVKRTYELSTILKEKMGCFLFQLPPSFTFTSQNLEHILTHLNPFFKNVIEFRHPSWWDPEVFKACKLANITICNTIGMRMPEIIIPHQTDLYVRFHGNSTYEANYDDAALLEWSQRIKELNAKEIWIYFNNTRLGHAPYNALNLRRHLNSF